VPREQPMRGGRNGGTGGPPLPPPRRGDAMVAAPSRAWHVFKPILPDPWDPFRPAPRPALLLRWPGGPDGGGRPRRHARRCAGHPRGASAGPPAGRALGPVVSSRRGAQGAQGPRPVPVAARGARWGHRRGAPAARCPPSRSRRWVAGHRSCPVPPPCAGGAGHRCCRHV